jgi:hypothetical protein
MAFHIQTSQFSLDHGGEGGLYWVLKKIAHTMKHEECKQIQSEI